MPCNQSDEKKILNISLYNSGSNQTHNNQISYETYIKLISNNNLKYVFYYYAYMKSIDTEIKTRVRYKIHI